MLPHKWKHICTRLPMSTRLLNPPILGLQSLCSTALMVSVQWIDVLPKRRVHYLVFVPFQPKSSHKSSSRPSTRDNARSSLFYPRTIIWDIIVMISIHFIQPPTSFHSHSLRLASAGGLSANLHLGYGGTPVCLWSPSAIRGVKV